MMNPTLNKSIAKNKLDRWVSELQSEQTFLTCKRHGYVARRAGVHGKGGPIPPSTHGCPDCWRAFYFTDFALTAPHERQERLDELEAVIHHTAEYAEKGKFGNDLELYEPGDPRFQVSIEKE